MAYSSSILTMTIVFLDKNAERDKNIRYSYEDMAENGWLGGSTDATGDGKIVVSKKNTCITFHARFGIHCPNMIKRSSYCLNFGVHANKLSVAFNGNMCLTKRPNYYCLL